MADVYEPRFVFVTKYCLGEGKIEKRVVKRVDDGGYIYVMGLGWSIKPGRDCFDDFGAAAVRANAMRDRKVASLKKQIARLEALEFTAEDA